MPAIASVMVQAIQIATTGMIVSIGAPYFLPATPAFGHWSRQPADWFIYRPTSLASVASRQQ